MLIFDRFIIRGHIFIIIGEMIGVSYKLTDIFSYGFFIATPSRQ